MLAKATAHAEYSVAERRSARRFPLRLDCIYEIFQEGRLQASGKATTANISTSGLLLQGAAGAQEGRRIHLVLSWPCGARSMSLAVSGRIVRADETGVGIRLLRHAFLPERASGSSVETLVF